MEKYYGEKSYAISYVFDNKFQASMMFRSILSVYNKGLNRNISLVIGISHDIYDEYSIIVKKFLDENKDLADINLNIIDCKFEPFVRRSNCMFYYLAFPFLTKHDFILKLDNDTILQNVDILSIIENLSSYDVPILGLRNHKEVNENLYKKTIINFIGETKYYKYKNNYINCGILLINTKRFKKMSKSLKNLTKKIKGVNDELWNIKESNGIWPDNDQIILFILFYKKLSSKLPKKYNRIEVPPDLLKEGKFEDSIYHFAYWIPNGNDGIKKVNVYDYFSNKVTIDEFAARFKGLGYKDSSYLKAIKKEYVSVWNFNKKYLDD